MNHAEINIVIALKYLKLNSQQQRNELEKKLKMNFRLIKVNPNFIK